MARNLQGEIPDDYHENDALPEKNTPPLSKESLEWIEWLKSNAMKIIRNKLGPIPDDHFENEPTYPPKNVSPLSKEWIEKIENFRDPKYHTGDIIGPY